MSNTSVPAPPPTPIEITKTEKHTVHWFRKGLRLHDNPSLREGLHQATTFRCIFIIDPWFAGSSNVGINKWRFLLQCLEDLDRSLKRLNSRLFVIRGQPAEALPKLFKEWGTTSLTFEEDPEPFGRVRDHNITAMCRENGITVISRVSHTLYKLDKIIERNGGRAPLTYHQFQAVIANMEAPNIAEGAITSTNVGIAITPIGDDHEDKYGVPTLEELGFDIEGLKEPTWIGGESEALARLERHLERKAWVASFGKPKMTPQSLMASQTGLSPYLRFGCLSTRLFYYKLTDLYKKIKNARPPLSLHGQLLWREFFYCAATRNPNFDKMAGNPICVQIPWDKSSEALAKWATGQTGYPWIDAIMRQLREEGWIHHLARHAVACFLTRGDLWLSWEEGMKVFEELLLDADWSVNAGTWMWLSCSSFFQQFFHCYCPIRFGKKADPNGDYIRKYIPVLKNFPTQYIHSPWLAPESVQQMARCVIGQDYPVPMVDHDKASRINIERIKQIYRQLAKFKINIINSEKGASVAFVANANASRPNAAISSPSPTSVITSVNHSTYLCNTTDSRNSQDIYSEQQQQEDQENFRKPQDDYDNCNKTVSDIFEEKQSRNSSGLQVRELPFKKIVVIEQEYEKLKQEPKTDINGDKKYTNMLKKQYPESMNTNESRDNTYESMNIQNCYNGISNKMYMNLTQQQPNFNSTGDFSNKPNNTIEPPYIIPNDSAFKQPVSLLIDMRKKYTNRNFAKVIPTSSQQLPMDYNYDDENEKNQTFNEVMQYNEPMKETTEKDNNEEGVMSQEFSYEEQQHNYQQTNNSIEQNIIMKNCNDPEP